MNDQEKGEKIGYIIGKYGTDIFACLGGMKLINKTKQLVAVNRALTMDGCFSSANNYRLMTQKALEKQAFRKSFTKLPFQPRLTQGNKNYGLRHIVKRHAHNTKARGVSRFSIGMGEKEIEILINDTIKKDLSYILNQKYFISDVNIGRVIGTNEQNLPSSLLRIVVNPQKNIVSAYPK